MRGGWGEAEIVWFESGCVICRAADHAEAIGHRPQAIPVDGMFSTPEKPSFENPPIWIWIWQRQDVDKPELMAGGPGDDRRVAMWWFCPGCQILHGLLRGKSYRFTTSPYFTGNIHTDRLETHKSYSPGLCISRLTRSDTLRV